MNFFIEYNNVALELTGFSGMILSTFLLAKYIRTKQSIIDAPENIPVTWQTAPINQPVEKH